MERSLVSPFKFNWLLALLLAAPLSAAPEEPQPFLERFEALRPKAEKLAVYRLEWVQTLAAAQTRAAEEDRPVLLIVVRNSLGDMITGHC